MDIKTKNVKTWKNEDDNLCFSYKMRSPMEKPAIIIGVGICFTILLLLESCFFKTYYSLFPLLILFMIVYFYWMTYPCRENELVEKIVMNLNIDLRLHNELKQFGENVHEVKRKFYQETKGTYGVVVGTYMLVLLSNGVILEYELKYHKPDKNEESFYEFIKHPVICNNLKHIKVIKPFNWLNLIKQIKVSENFKCFFAILGLLTIGAFFIFVYFFLVILYGLKFLAPIVGYLIVYNFLVQQLSRSEKKFAVRLGEIISLPFMVLKISFSLISPIIVVLLSIIFLFLFSFGIPLITLCLLKYLIGFNINIDTMLFITLAVGSIISVHGAKFIHWLIREHSPLKNYENHEYESIKTELALYLVHKNNVNFFIYLLYFVFFSLSGLIQIQYDTPFISANIDTVILNAFLVFMAYSSMAKESKIVEIKAKPLIEKMIKLITTHDKM